MSSTITHGRVKLALHQLQPGEGMPLLALHDLYQSAEQWRQSQPGFRWTGAVYALDFSGHGRSESVRGGSYSAELLVGDADSAVTEITKTEGVGAVAVAGIGLGAYVALLLAGARSACVCASLLLPGPGAAGGGPEPTVGRRSAQALPIKDHRRPPGEADPEVELMDRRVRPPDYALELARAARTILTHEDDTPRPPWWERLREAPKVERIPGTRADAFLALQKRAEGLS